MDTGTEVDWRIRADGPGRHEVRIDLEGEKIIKEIVVGEGLHRLSPQRPSTLWRTVLYPAETPLPRESAFLSVEMDYPPAKVRFLRWRQHWLVYFFILSIVFAFAFKGPLRVEI